MTQVPDLTKPSSTVSVRNASLPKAAAVLAEQIRAQILGQGLEPGSQLPSEPELIAQSGLGRATVREAIRILEGQGLIMIKRGSRGGMFVAQPDLSSLSHTLAPVLTLSKAPLRDLTTYRLMVEPPAAGLAASNASESDRADLLKLAEHGPGPGFVNEVRFHERVAVLSGNELLRALVVVPNDLLREHLKGESIDAHDVDEANEAHLAIARAIVAGDAARATKTMTRHLEAFEARMSREARLDRPIVSQEQWLREAAGSFGFDR
ncbi:FadR/GntR family transcriptional regulator [Nocardioides astragali]|uniref:FadR/GntR family transcriptional regulator n=1 Tax=Nocardioides astragali TaxID=1776736 RepID=A0ABW2N8S8_9ACTN|nr:FCD domain-containing protein [Nocardioides astragali]